MMTCSNVFVMEMLLCVELSLLVVISLYLDVHCFSISSWSVSQVDVNAYLSSNNQCSKIHFEAEFFFMGLNKYLHYI